MGSGGSMIAPFLSIAFFEYHKPFMMSILLRYKTEAVLKRRFVRYTPPARFRLDEVLQSSPVE